MAPTLTDPILKQNHTQANAVLSTLIRPDRMRVGYDEIEAAMEGIGLDPFRDGEIYQWLIGQLESRDIVVADGDFSDAPDVETLERMAEQAANEVADLLDETVDVSGAYLPPLLTAQEERELLQIVRDGDRAQAEMEQAVSEEHIRQLQRCIRAAAQASDELIARHMRLVYSIATRYAGRTRQLELDDLVQEGVIGLITAVRKFDLDRNTRLSTYAMCWIRQAVTRAIANQDRTVRLPMHLVETINRLKMVENKLHQLLARAPSEEELAQMLGQVLNPPPWPGNGSGRDLMASGVYSQQELEHAVQRIRAWQRIAAGEPVSIDLPVGDGEGSALGDIIPAPEAVSPEKHYEQTELHKLLEDLLAGLTQREREVLVQRFGIDNGDGRTLQEVGVHLGLTSGHAGKIEETALGRLRHTLCSENIRDLLEIV